MPRSLPQSDQDTDEHPLLHSPDWTHGWTPTVTQSWLDTRMNTHGYTVLTGHMEMNTHCYTVLTGHMDEHPLLHSPDWTHGWTPIVTQSWLDSWWWTPTVTQSWLDSWRWTPIVTQSWLDSWMNTHCYTVLTGHMDEHPLLHSPDWTHGDEHPLLHSHDWTHGDEHPLLQSWLDTWMNTHCYTFINEQKDEHPLLHSHERGKKMNTHCYTVMTGHMDEHPSLHSWPEIWMNSHCNTHDWTNGCTPIITLTHTIFQAGQTKSTNSF